MKTLGWDLFRDKVVKCRKPHKCDLCGIEIKIGETARYFSGKWEGEFTDGYECSYCQNLIIKLHNNDLLDMHEYSEDGFAEAAQEYLCGNCLNQCDMSRVSNEEWDRWEKERVDDNENCRVGAYLKHCRCEYYKGEGG